MRDRIDTSHSSKVAFLILRFMRRPLMTLIVVYVVSMAGWVIVPGVDPDGNPARLSFFHAFYFLTYTATTTGFGELPYAFSDGQRMWGIVTLYASVVAWLYALGAIIRLLQNPNFRQEISKRRFAERVERMSEPFFIICGFGNTGSLLARGLSDSNIAAVVIDNDPERVKALMLRDYRVDMPGICADLEDPSVLIEAGLRKKNCRGVLALTADEVTNLKISATARLLHPEVPIVTRSTSATFEKTLSSLGGRIHIIDPFQTFARYLSAMVRNPMIHTLNRWAAGTPDVMLEPKLNVPRGRWILCGFGRMGKWLRRTLEAEGIETVAIESNKETVGDAPNVIVGRANHDTLTAAGILQADGIVVATNSDSENLGIVINAKALKSDIFLIVRQNNHRNKVVFQAAQADLIMQPSLVAARRTLFLLTAPLLKTFFEASLAHESDSAHDLLRKSVEQLEAVVGSTQPRIWTFHLSPETADAALSIIRQGYNLRLGDILRDPTDLTRRLACVPLVLEDGSGSQILPDLETPLTPSSRLLLCGSSRAYHHLTATLRNEYTLRYLIFGWDEPRGLVMRWFAKRVQRQDYSVKSALPLAELGPPIAR